MNGVTNIGQIILDLVKQIMKGFDSAKDAATGIRMEYRNNCVMVFFPEVPYVSQANEVDKALYTGYDYEPVWAENGRSVSMRLTGPALDNMEQCRIDALLKTLSIPPPEDGEWVYPQDFTADGLARLYAAIMAVPEEGWGESPAPECWRRAFPGEVA